MKNKVPPGLKTPYEIQSDKTLSAIQKDLLAAVVQLHQVCGVCFASNGYLADWLGMPEDTVVRNLVKLEKMSRISKKLYRDKKGAITKREMVPVGYHRRKAGGGG